jgi:hypothetical protein
VSVLTVSYHDAARLEWELERPPLVAGLIDKYGHVLSSIWWDLRSCTGRCEWAPGGRSIRLTGQDGILVRAVLRAAIARDVKRTGRCECQHPLTPILAAMRPSSGFQRTYLP